MRYETEIKFKLLGKHLEQKKYSGIENASWTSEDSGLYLSYVRGKSNIVQVFDTQQGEVTHSVDLNETVENPIRGLHGLPGDDPSNLMVNSGGCPHIVVDEKANSFLVNPLAANDTDSELCEELFKLKGDHVTRSYLLKSQALARGSTRQG